MDINLNISKEEITKMTPEELRRLKESVTEYQQKLGETLVKLEDINNDIATKIHELASSVDKFALDMAEQDDEEEEIRNRLRDWSVNSGKQDKDDINELCDRLLSFSISSIDNSKLVLRVICELSDS